MHEVIFLNLMKQINNFYATTAFNFFFTFFNLFTVSQDETEDKYLTTVMELKPFAI